MKTKAKNILRISHIKVHNANALSSPFTIGFPAMTAWLGAVHALQRKLNGDGFEDLEFKAVAVLNHKAGLQVHKGVGDYVYSIVGTSNPVDKEGKRPPFIEEPRIHLAVSLLIEFNRVDRDEKENLEQRVKHHLASKMKMAGGDIISVGEIKINNNIKTEQDLAPIRRKLMPSYAIVERRDLMIEAMERGLDAMDALLDYVVIHNSCTMEEDKVVWKKERRAKGWIVPIATGFQAISELGKAKNQRDPNTPHRFAESVVTLGEFKMVYKIASLDEILWHYSVDREHGLYLCEQNR